jgi:hypothetical protein
VRGEALAGMGLATRMSERREGGQLKSFGVSFEFRFHFDCSVMSVERKFSFRVC